MSVGRAGEFARPSNVSEIAAVGLYRIISLQLTFAILLATGCSPKAGSPIEPTATAATWLTDFKQAQDLAKSANKLLLVDFTGSDWCGWCIKLNREVFSRPEFRDYADKNLVLLKVDFPRGKEIPAAERAQNNQLAELFNVDGFPTIIVIDVARKKTERLGYMPGGPAAFIAELDKIRKG